MPGVLLCSLLALAICYQFCFYSSKRQLRLPGERTPLCRGQEGYPALLTCFSEVPVCGWGWASSRRQERKEAEGRDLRRSLEPLLARVTGARLSQKLLAGRSSLGQPLLLLEAPVGLFVGWAAATRLVGGPWVGACCPGPPCPAAAAHLSEHLNFPSLYDRPIQLLPGSVSI